MPKKTASLENLSRRERQIMDVLYRNGRASAAEVRQEMPEAPSYSAVRALLRILEEKGCAEHDEEGPRYVYKPTAPLKTARRMAARRLLETFFEGSVPRPCPSAHLGLLGNRDRAGGRSLSPSPSSSKTRATAT